jgi:protein-L-isoaspartate(D-aspartate) O-methyltransferase
MDEETYYQNERSRMVAEQIAERGVQDPRLLEVMRRLPRHLFVPPEYRHQAYYDGPLPIGNGQTISQPYIVALMTETLRLQGFENVLEIGTGSGYQAAVLACLARQVHTIERYPELADKASIALAKVGCGNVIVHVGDGSLGLPEFAPYQAILVTAAAPRVPQALLEQLDDDGRLVIPVGGRMGQYLECWVRQGVEYSQEVLVPVAFVPLRGKLGWNGEE